MTRSNSSGPRGTESSSPTTSSSGSSSGGDVKQTMREVAHRAKESASNAMTEAQEKASSAIDHQKEMASDRLESVASAIRETARRLHDDQEDAMGSLADQAAERVERVSGYLRDHDLRDLIRDAQDVARRHPAIFLGSAFVAGALLGRFLRSSQRHGRDVEFDSNEFSSSGSVYRSSSLEDDSFSSYRGRSGRARSMSEIGRQADMHEDEGPSPSMARQYGSSTNPGMTPPISGGWPGAAQTPSVQSEAAESTFKDSDRNRESP